MNKLLMLSLIAVMAAGTLVQAQRGNRDAGRSGPQPFGPNAQFYTPQPRTIPSLPLGCTLLTIDGVDYYYGAGQYYRPGSGGFLVVPAPIGATLTELPPGTQQVLLGDMLCYIVNGVAYRKTVSYRHARPSHNRRPSIPHPPWSQCHHRLRPTT